MDSAAIEGPVLMDTGPLVALLTTRDSAHQRCRQQLARLRTPPITCWPVITEAAWLLKHSRNVERLMALLESGELEIAPLHREDISAITAILAKYADLRVQLADACLVHLASRDGIHTIFTLDRRDFGVLRGTRRNSFQIIP